MVHDLNILFFGELIMEDNFDYIIIGAGSAGCVLANKLSENEKFCLTY